MVKLTWDETKRQANIEKHGLDFAYAAEVFEGPTFSSEIERPTRRGTEKRVLTVGVIQNTIIVLVVWTARDATRRIISMRKANEKERKQFEGIL